MLCFRYRWSALTVLATLASPVGCTQFAEDGSTEEVASRSSEVLLFHADQSAETVVTTPHFGGFVVSSNEDDPAFISYTDTSRRVFTGASLMGWHLFHPEEDNADGRVRPPSGWSVLWGDPAIVRLRGVPSRVYMGSLAIPNGKMPAAGFIEGSVISNDPALCGAHIGGGCIARSLDFGNTFTLKASDCVRRTTPDCPNGTFYDGMDLETSVNAARIWAAFTDVHRASTDVYLAMFSTSSFARVTDPPRGGEVRMHPRIRLGSNGLYLVQQGSSSNLTITRYPDISRLDQAWTTPVQIAPTAHLFENIQLTSDASNFIRVGPQYDLDIGLNENGVEEVRIVYTVIISGRSHIRVAKCTTGTPIVCQQPSTWRTDTFQGHQFFPSIAYGLRSDNVPIWALSFQSNQRFPGQNRVELVRAHLLNATSFNWALQETRVNIPCPDVRGYWGDYDNMAIGTGPDGANGMTVRGLTQDFSGKSCFRRQFTATPQQSITSHWFH